MVPLPSLEELEVDFKSLVVMSNSVEGTPENESGDKESWSDELTEPNSSATSPRIDPNIVLYSHIAFLYEQRKFYELLASIPNINTNSSLPSEIHLMLACTLFRLGRIMGGLREMSLAIELEPIYYKREKYIKTLSQFFNKIGMKEEAVSCFGEIIHMAKAEALKKNDGEHGQQMSLKLRRYQEELEALLRGDDEEEVVMVVEDCSNLSLVEQAKRYLSANGMIPKMSMVTDCMAVSDLLGKANKALEEWNDEVDKRPASDILNWIFDAVKYLAPLSLFDEVYQILPLLETFMNWEMCRFPEIDYGMDPIKFARKLRTWGISNKTGIRSLCCIIVKHKVVMAHIEYYKKNYSAAIIHFTWVFKVMKRLERTVPIIQTPVGCLSLETKQVVLLYLCNCYCLDPAYSNSKLPHVITQMATLESPPDSTYGRSCKYFTFLGYAYEKLAYNEAQSIMIWKNGTGTSAFRLKQSHIMDMLRKYILATANGLDDDPSVLEVYDRIIWGILVHGGIHLRTLWFFIVLKNYFYLEFDFGCFQLSKGHRYLQFEINRILDFFVNGWEIVDKCKDLCSDIEGFESDDIWNVDHGNLYLIPQIYVTSKSLVLMNEQYDDRLDVNSFVYMSKYQIKPKIKSCFKRTKETSIYKERIDASQELIHLWCTAYREHHHTIPGIISDLVV
ncbi:hypothetical protein G9P44_002205 [Scheffersomyces stipitis]|nr:hypothetical protein G9P44_002205 [Scheffersomyces stipitis]